MLTRLLSAVTAVTAIGLLCGCRTTPKVEYEVVKEEHKALADRVEEMLRQTRNTPGHEHANRIRSYHLKNLKKLRGEKPAKKGEFAKCIPDIRNIIATAERGLDWPHWPEIHVPEAGKELKIDGKLDEPAWAKAYTWRATYPFSQKERVDTPKTVWRITWDEKYLYFAFECEDTDVVSPKRKRDDHVYFDDCAEIMIMSEPRFRVYWELVVGPSGSIYDSIQCKKYDKWGADQYPEATMKGLLTGISIDGTLNKSDDVDKGYTVEMAVPFSQLPGYSRALPKKGDKLRFVMIRLDRQGKRFAAYAFKPLLSWGHNIWDHATMVLQ